MDARPNHPLRAVAAGVLLLIAAAAEAQRAQPVSLLRSGGYRTENFVVQAPTPELAREIGETAESLRENLAIEWLGSPMPRWREPCPISAKVSPRLGAGGATSFVFDRGEVFGWEMNVQGSRERVLDSVLPHEITHTVFASHFRQPLPRWADEGACTTVEHDSEVAKQEALLIRFLKTGKGIPFTRMFAMKEYPADILPLYAQGHSLTQFLMESRGRKAFLDFVADGLRDDNWRRAVQQHYGRESLYALQTDWLRWVEEGRPHLAVAPSAGSADVVAATATAPPTATLASIDRGVAARPSVYAQRMLPSTNAPESDAPRRSVYASAAPDGSVWR